MHSRESCDHRDHLEQPSSMSSQSGPPTGVRTPGRAAP
jgi:hypothetical protein